MGKTWLQDANEVATPTMRLSDTDIQTVVEHWNELESPTSSEAIRVFHGRGHCYPGLEGLCIEYFSPVLVIRLYEQPQEERLQALCEALVAVHVPDAIQGIVVQRRYLTPTQVELAWGELPEDPVAREDGLSYHLNLSAQNVGFFIDMRNARRWMAERVQGWNVLNLFSYTCAFSVVAMKHGASQVVNIDVHSPFLSIGRNNHRLNLESQPNVKYLCHNVMKSWSKLRRLGPYDLIIHDPPQNQGNNFRTERDYQKVVRRLGQMMRPGGYVMACLNSPHHDYQYLLDSFAEASPSWEAHCILLPPKDFPDTNPNQGLKIMLFQWMGSDDS